MVGGEAILCPGEKRENVSKVCKVCMTRLSTIGACRRGARKAGATVVAPAPLRISAACRSSAPRRRVQHDDRADDSYAGRAATQGERQHEAAQQVADGAEDRRANRAARRATRHHRARHAAPDHPDDGPAGSRRGGWVSARERCSAPLSAPSRATGPCRWTRWVVDEQGHQRRRRRATTASSAPTTPRMRPTRDAASPRSPLPSFPCMGRAWPLR